MFIVMVTKLTNDISALYVKSIFHQTNLSLSICTVCIPRAQCVMNLSHQKHFLKIICILFMQVYYSMRAHIVLQLLPKNQVLKVTSLLIPMSGGSAVHYVTNVLGINHILIGMRVAKNIYKLHAIWRWLSDFNYVTLVLLKLN